MVENEVKNLIGRAPFMERFLSDYQNFHSQFFVVNEVEVENRITMDHVVYDQQSGEAIALIESKGGDIGITEYLRGIGQVMQYQQHFEKKKVLKYDPKCLTYLAFPDELFNSFDVTKLAYPKKVKLLIINPRNESSSVMDPATISGSTGLNSDIVRISPYYIRDNRLGELYLGLLELRKRSFATPHATRVSRNFNDLAREIGFPNPGNGRNIGISLSSLGLIDAFNRPTIMGLEMSEKSFGGFVVDLLNEYLYPYVNTIFEALMNITIRKGELVTSWQELNQEIQSIWGGKEVMFLTESGNRYISSWMNILRDDLGAIDFRPRAQEKEIIIKYAPLKGTPILLDQSFSSNTNTPDYVKRYLGIS